MYKETQIAAALTIPKTASITSHMQIHHVSEFGHGKSQDLSQVRIAAIESQRKTRKPVESNTYQKEGPINMFDLTGWLE